MKIQTPQFIWHSASDKYADRVYSVDFQPHTRPRRFATSGEDEFVHVWIMPESHNTGDNSNSLNVDILARLIGHTKCVNMVRFSPDGTTLASGSADEMVFLWQPTHTKPPVPFGMDASAADGFTEYWKQQKSLRCGSPVLSIAWSPDGTNIAAGVEADEVFVWDCATGKLQRRLSGHTHHVCGLAWDPKNSYIASMSSDQSVRFWNRGKQAPLSGNTQLVANFKSAYTIKNPTQILSSEADGEEKGEAECDERENVMVDENNTQTQPHTHIPEKTIRRALFYGETGLRAFFRRPEWSPDGSVLVVPAGSPLAFKKYTDTDTHTNTHTHTQENTDSKESVVFLPTTHLLARDDTLGPVATFPSVDGASVSVRFNPIVFETMKIETEERSWMFGDSELSNLRFIFAVLTIKGSVYIYDTQHKHPIWRFSNLHLQGMTDATWSHDGRILVVSSSDGYCTIIEFSDEDLGITT